MARTFGDVRKDVLRAEGELTVGGLRITCEGEGKDVDIYEEGGGMITWLAGSTPDETEIGEFAITFIGEPKAEAKNRVRRFLGLEEKEEEDKTEETTEEAKKLPQIEELEKEVERLNIEVGEADVRAEEAERKAERQEGRAEGLKEAFDILVGRREISIGE